MSPPHTKKLNQALAQDVLTQARATMQMIANQTPTRVSKGRTALEHWSGADADQFQPKFSAMQKDAHNLHGRLQTLIRQINTALDAS